MAMIKYKTYLSAPKLHFILNIHLNSGLLQISIPTDSANIVFSLHVVTFSML